MSRPAILPPPVGPGDRVGVAALSGVVEAEALERGVAALAALGFDPVLAANLRSRRGLFAGSDAARLDGFHRLAADPAIKAIFFARGGHGVLRLLPGLDWELLRRRPRAYVGYSDLTPFLLEVVRRLGRISFYGPMVAIDLARGLEPLERRSLLGALAGEPPPPLALRALRGRRRVEGPLLGGCLSLLTACLGTPFAPRLDGAILFWEDIAEPLYRLDRMLTQLRLAGNLAAIVGMVVGEVEVEDDASEGADLSETLVDLSRDLGWPVARGCPSGHCRPNVTLPLGMTARLSPAAGRLDFRPPSSARAGSRRRSSRSSG